MASKVSPRSVVEDNGGTLSRVASAPTMVDDSAYPRAIFQHPWSRLVALNFQGK